MGVALLTDEQLRALLEDAAERGARRALESTAAAELTTEQAASVLEIAPKTVIKWAQSGRLKVARKVGKTYRFHRAEVEAAKKGGPVSDAARKALATLGLGQR